METGRKEVRVVAAAIVRDGRVLAARHGEKHARAGLWELPGGKVEPGESDRDALAREITEELAMRVTVGESLGEAVFAYPEITVRLHAYACTSSDEPAPAEHEAVAWLGVDEIDTVDWAPADRPLLDALRVRLQ